MSDTDSVKVDINKDNVLKINDEEAEELLNNGSNNKVLCFLNSQDSLHTSFYFRGYRCHQ